MSQREHSRGGTWLCSSKSGRNPHRLMFVVLTGVTLLTLLPNQLTGVESCTLLARITYDSSSRNRMESRIS